MPFMPTTYTTGLPNVTLLAAETTNWSGPLQSRFLTQDPILSGLVFLSILIWPGCTLTA